MPITDSFRNAVANGDVDLIRIMMKDSLLIDSSFKEFNEMEAEAIKGVSEAVLYDSHDNRELVSDNSAWDRNYMNKLMVQVVGNFSHERVNHLKEVVRKLNPIPASRQTQASSGEYQDQKLEDKRKGDYIGPKLAVTVGVGTLAGVAIAAMVSTRIVTGLVVGGVVGAVVGGVIISMSKK